MKNKQGFTLVEVVVTFSLVSVIAILLFQIIMMLREVYVSGDIQTTLITKQGILERKVEDDIRNRGITRITSCGDYCITFSYEDGIERNLSLDPNTQTIRYYDYSWKLGEGSQLGKVETTVYVDSSITDMNVNNGILKIVIPVSNKLLEQDYGITILYQYQTSKTSIPTRIEKPAGLDEELYQQYAFFR